jgi:NAD(P)H dehydrogenase (quinone)
MDPIAVTGVTGAVGSRVARHLNRLGHPVRLVARDLSQLPINLEGDVVAASYDDEPAMTAAFTGAPTVFLVSGREAEDRLEHLRRAVAAAGAAGVGKIVYTSFLGAGPEATFVLARQHFHTEQLIRDSGAAFVFLRDSMYTDFIPYFAGKDGVIRGPAGDGRVSWVTRDDVAAVATRVLVSPDHDGSTLDVTGPEAVTLAETADRLSRHIGRPVSYHDETVDEAYASRASYGAPDWEVEGWVTSYQAIANGDLAEVGDAVERITGRPAHTIEDFLKTHPESYQHLTG